MFKLFSILLLLFFLDQVLAWRPRRSFQHFFPDVQAEIESAIVNNCSSIFQDYLNEEITLYGHHYAKDNMASAAVLLGLTPFILASLGSNTTELALISSKRPLLAILLVLGSPSVNPIRTFDYPNPAKDIDEGKNKLVLSKINDRRPHSIGNITRVIIELVLVVASVVNLATLSWTITLNTIAVTSCDSDTLVQLWIGCAIFTHIFGVATFFTGSETKYHEQKHTSVWGRVKQWFLWETSPCATHPEYTLKRKEHNKWFIFFSWLASTYTLTHIGFGVTVFSSLSFVGSLDAGVILGRFGASAIVCRAVATYELAGMRAAKKLKKCGNVRQMDAIELEEGGVVIKSEVSTDKGRSRSQPASLLQEREVSRMAERSTAT